MEIKEVEEIFYKTLLMIVRLYEDEAKYIFTPTKDLNEISFCLHIMPHQSNPESYLTLKYFQNIEKFSLHFATIPKDRISEITETTFNARANSIKSLIEDFFGNLLCNADLILDWKNGEIKFIGDEEFK